MLIFLCFPSIIYLSMAVAKETEFEFWGFIFVMLAAVMSGFRWSMTQILLQVGLCLCF
jgi:solute carrier family 35 protein C2